MAGGTAVRTFFFVEGAHYVERIFCFSRFFFFLFSCGCFETGSIGWLLAGRRFLARSVLLSFFRILFGFSRPLSTRRRNNDKLLPLFRLSAFALVFFSFLFGLVWMLYTGSDFDWARLLFVGLFCDGVFFFNATSFRSCERRVHRNAYCLFCAGEYEACF